VTRRCGIEADSGRQPRPLPETALVTVAPTSTKRVVPDRRCDSVPSPDQETNHLDHQSRRNHRCGSGIVELAGSANAAIDVVANYTASLSSFAGRKAIFLLALI
jgi:hypothetical protein